MFDRKRVCIPNHLSEDTGIVLDQAAAEFRSCERGITRNPLWVRSYDVQAKGATPSGLIQVSVLSSSSPSELKH